tara:strand:+ start:560 stop:763 length:204 start_codon:yes stop_codon:yes gene_type:complete
MKLKDLIEEGPINPDDGGEILIMSLKTLKFAIQKVKNPEKWAEKYPRSLPKLVDTIDTLVKVLGKMK